MFTYSVSFERDYRTGGSPFFVAIVPNYTQRKDTLWIFWTS